MQRRIPGLNNIQTDGLVTKKSNKNFSYIASGRSSAQEKTSTTNLICFELKRGASFSIFLLTRYTSGLWIWILGVWRELEDRDGVIWSNIKGQLFSFSTKYSFCGMQIWKGRNGSLDWRATDIVCLFLRCSSVELRWCRRRMDGWMGWIMAFSPLFDHLSFFSYIRCVFCLSDWKVAV
jgi:hypothetical protein